MALTFARGWRRVSNSVNRMMLLPVAAVQHRAYARPTRPPPQPEPTEHPVYKVGGLYEPDYLHLLKPPTEEYELLDIDIEGYDFPVLEKYHKYVFKQIRDLGLTHYDSYGHPNQVIDVEILKPRTEVVQEVHHLRVYKRTVQLADVPVYMIGLIIDVLHATAPPGVTFTIETHSPEREENRYVPDVYLTESKRDLEALVRPKH